MKQRTEAERISRAIAKLERRVKAGKPEEPGRETWEARMARLTLRLLRVRASS